MFGEVRKLCFSDMLFNERELEKKEKKKRLTEES